jgi:hypothetical protein
MVLSERQIYDSRFKMVFSLQWEILNPANLCFWFERELLASCRNEDANLTKVNRKLDGKFVKGTVDFSNYISNTLIHIDNKNKARRRN